MPELPTKTANILDLPLSNPLNVQSTYSNVATVFAVEHECRLVFMEVIMVNPKGEPRTEMKANLVLSWSAIANLVTSLQQTIANHDSRIKK